MANSNGYVMEHRLVMAQQLGRPLTEEEIVHHKGAHFPQGSIENKQDNSPENLELVATESKHKKMVYEELQSLRTRILTLESRNTQLEAETILLRTQLEKDRIG